MSQPKPLEKPPQGNTKRQPEAPPRQNVGAASPVPAGTKRLPSAWLDATVHMAALSMLALALALFLVTGCAGLSDTPAPQPTAASKTVTSKVTAIEPRYDNWSGKRMPVSVYYLVAQDGSVTEVPLTTWTKVQVGQTYSAPAAYWQTEQPNQSP